MSAYYLVALGFIGGFGVGSLFMLWLWMRARPEDFGEAGSATPTGGWMDDAPESVKRQAIEDGNPEG